MGWKVLVTVVLAVFVAGCAQQQALEGRVGMLETSVAKLDLTSKKVDAQMEQIGKLSADLEAERAYFKDVKDYVRLMRDDTVGLIDEQRKRVEEGRAEYLRILRRQKELMVSLQGEVDLAMTELEKKPAQAGATIPQPPATPAFKAGTPVPETKPSVEPAAKPAQPAAVTAPAR